LHHLHPNEIRGLVVVGSEIKANVQVFSKKHLGANSLWNSAVMKN